MENSKPIELKKIFYGQFYFALPDDFDGDLADAIFEWAKYRKEKRDAGVAINDVTDTIENGAVTWDDFVKATQEGKRFHGGVLIAKLKEDNTWEYMKLEK